MALCYGISSFIKKSVFGLTRCHVWHRKYSALSQSWLGTDWTHTSIDGQIMISQNKSNAMHYGNTWIWCRKYRWVFNCISSPKIFGTVCVMKIFTSGVCTYIYLRDIPYVLQVHILTAATLVPTMHNFQKKITLQLFYFNSKCDKMSQPPI